MPRRLSRRHRRASEAIAGDDVPVTGEVVDSGWVVDDLVRHTEDAALWSSSTAPWAGCTAFSPARSSTASPDAPTSRSSRCRRAGRRASASLRRNGGVQDPVGGTGLAPRRVRGGARPEGLPRRAARLVARLRLRVVAVDTAYRDRVRGAQARGDEPVLARCVPGSPTSRSRSECSTRRRSRPCSTRPRSPTCWSWARRHHLLPWAATSDPSPEPQSATRLPRS